ncbi:MAG: hypothetical protein A3B68_00915 [Candidatus Melainabacteria bacterium RIFCSPHIGHO2_02_FULL_34_12]|nr:MAG: hypothetical protein A3B68_00915 [Candidatus Melainabacteria bacterium RIFCSPHIGHO2_02_FULL_34_12]
MNQNYWLERLLSDPRDFIDSFYKQGKYYQKIRNLDKNNKKRNKPRTYFVFTLDEEDAKRNATFSTFEFGIKEHMITRGYLNKLASFLPMSMIKERLHKLAGVVIEENVFIAPDVIIDPVLRGWTRFHKGCSIGWGAKFFNHLFEDNGRIVIGYIEVGEEASLGGFVAVSPGVTIGKKANIGAEVKIAPGVTIGDHAKIGAGAFIMPFLTIGEEAEVAMGSVVIESVPPRTKVQGNPAKVVDENIRNRKPKLDLIINPNMEKENKMI